MPRSLSLVRRRPNLVDLTLQARPGIASYRFYSSTNFDGAFVLFETVPAAGKVSATVLNTGYAEGFRNQTRFLFNPVDYALTDTSPLWVYIEQIAIDGTVGAAEARHLILPYSSQPNRSIVVAGTAPNVGSLASSLELQLPMQCNDMRVQVDGGVALMLAFERGGPEQRVPVLATDFIVFSKSFDSFSQIFVRGSGATTTFSLSAALRNNPI